MAITRTILAVVSVLFGIVLTLPIFVLGLPFLLVTFFTRAFSRLLEPRTVPWQEIIEYYPTLGWKPKANLNTYGLADEVFHLTTDSDGWRGRTSLQESDVVVFGDSYAFGYGVNDQEFLAELNHNLRVKSIGANGYNMVQSLLWMERLAPKLGGKLIVWLVYYGNDLYDNLQPNLYHYRMPFVCKVNGAGGWEIVTSHVNSSKWPYPSERRYDLRLAEICCRTFLSERVFSACEFLIEKGNSLCHAVSTRLVVMSIPENLQVAHRGLEYLASIAPDPKSFDPDFPDQRISEICTRLDIPFVGLKDHLGETHYKASDPHWNAKGHKRVAEVVYGLYQDHILNRK